MAISEKDLTAYEVTAAAEKYYVTWKDVEEFVREAAKHIPKGTTGLYGIPRGGVVFAAMLSHLTGLPYLTEPTEGCLLVDDIVDSGKTMQSYGKPLIAMYCYIHSKVKPIWYWKSKVDKWIVFPIEAQVHFNPGGK